ncbi:zinc-dependent metalloprotease [Epilithonimonas xixisoli]|uniref:Putative secreted protein (Por secretion system target) n=1 Tax=Epilithonimonas xixisoli TaxID=1476462 RepID=A0A4R8ICX8_9FLAO|nr:zinc-dependent metalloprotease [Epilithonimonas xixisoli]TDX82595.1 putative secreted protein (Por secretion system target) [Epilithonimonas xixisoli]
MKKFLLLVSSAFFLSAYGQKTCGTDKKMAEFFASNPEAKANKQALRDFLVNNNYTANKGTKAVVTIPVVVHVLYKNGAQNVSDAQIASQLKVLNDDFRKLNADFNTVVPAAFKPVGADLELAFCLATKKPDGSATSGIERKAVSNSFVFGNSYYKSSGLPAWNPTKYLNIWVGKFDGFDEFGEPWEGTLGFAYLPDAAGLSYDGLCIGYDVFGTTGTAEAPFNKGRTGTHEIGHYFGLNHIWGDEEDSCGTSAGSDGCADTPATKQPYYGEDNPVFPDNQFTCSSSTNGAMFMNYMDYVYDAQMAMFTNNQKTITQNTMAGPRASLLNSNACSLLAVDDVEKSNSINVFPNPAVNYISIASPLVKINEVEIFASDGKLVKKANVQNETDKIDVKNLPSGTYYVRTYNGSGFVKSLKFIKN